LGELFQRTYSEFRARPYLAVIRPIFERLCSVLAAREPREYPTPLQYELMMKSFAKNTDTVGAKRLYEQFQLTGLQPTSLFYAALVHTTAKAGNMIEGLRLVDEMRAVDGMDFAAGYGSLISGLFRAEYSPAGIESVFDRMRASGCLIETRVLATMVMIAGRTGNVARALELLETAKSAWRAECAPGRSTRSSPHQCAWQRGR
jgi:pentatricopeptide repeat protein